MHIEVECILLFLRCIVIFLSVCVRERQRERERGKIKAREKARERETERVYVCISFISVNLSCARSGRTHSPIASIHGKIPRLVLKSVARTHTHTETNTPPYFSCLVATVIEHIFFRAYYLYLCMHPCVCTHVRACVHVRVRLHVFVCMYV